MSEDRSETHGVDAHSNRLIHETSPYLLQHAHNPVDWYPWGSEAFEKARTEDKPILLSVGYSACHWCHVMAHESFENEDTARIINEHFVSIKVDREERPDVDALYMDAVQALTGNGGWPMTVFLTPDGAPFYGGTYFPPRDRYGMPGFPRVLMTVAGWWATRRDDLEQQAAEFREWYRKQGELRIEPPEDVKAASDEVGPEVLEAAAEHLLGEMDTVNGGFGRAPKFPHPMALEFLLRVESRRRRGRSGGDESPADGRLLRLVRLTLDKMAAGGIYDQIGGGFHRYATDAIWLVPHFEKMLYDNALLAPVYLHAWQLTGDDTYRRTCEETLDYVLREMTDPLGGFYSTQDADSEGVEGKFYVWTPAELRSALGEDDAEIAERAWGVTHQGNFEGANILHVEEGVVEVAAALDVSVERVCEALARARTKLYEARARRVWPGRDDKVLAAWNGFMLRAMAEAGRILGRDDYLDAARKNAGFILEHLVREGRLQRTWRAGQAKIEAYLDDHAALVNGLLALYEATGDARFFAEGRRWADALLERFWSDAAGGFFDTAHDAEELIGRPRELTDNATPSGTSLAAEGLLRLAALTGEERYREAAARVLAPLVPAMARQPSAFGHLLCALDDLIGPFYEVAIVAGRDTTGADAMLRAVAARYRPRMALAAGRGYAAAEDAAPLLSGREAIGGKATAYVCQGFVCRQPVTDTRGLDALLDA